ncbi:MAG: biotin/lipoate A/B protein ligase family protein [Candidatus Woesearchaeota archaeon]
MDEWRVIPLEKEQDSFMKMAVEEAIMNSVRIGISPPTLRFYAWNKPAVALGYFQETSKELDIKVCNEDGIEIFRRITGGGAVYKSPKFELNYSFIIREDDQKIPKDVEASYDLLCGAIIKGLEKIGFKTEFKPINDILLDGKKISGNAQTRIDNVLLHHGTILLKPEVEKMFKYLKIDDKKLLEKKVKTVNDLVTGLLDYKSITKEDVWKAIVDGFKKTFDAKFRESELSQIESDDATKIYPKYADKNFVFWR